MKEDILKELEPLFERARKENMWFYCPYQDMWLSPNELREYHNENRFVWGAVNWELRNPNELIEKKYNLIKNIYIEIENISMRILKSELPTMTKE